MKRSPKKISKPGMAPGFTVLEVGIALVLLGLILGVAIPSVNSISGAELKKMTGLIRGLVREVYARTSLTSHPHRIVFDMERSQYWVEETEGGVLIRKQEEWVNREGKAILDLEDERLEDIDEDDDDPASQKKRHILQGPSWAKIDDRELGIKQLPAEVRFHGVWVDHMVERARDGQVALHFFPGGYTQEAMITLSDDEVGDRSYTLWVQSLTGEIFLEEDELEIPRD